MLIYYKSASQLFVHNLEHITIDSKCWVSLEFDYRMAKEDAKCKADKIGDEK